MLATPFDRCIIADTSLLVVAAVWGATFPRGKAILPGRIVKPDLGKPGGMGTGRAGPAWLVPFELPPAGQQRYQSLVAGRLPRDGNLIATFVVLP
jgi:hypothetical protein